MRPSSLEPKSEHTSLAQMVGGYPFRRATLWPLVPAAALAPLLALSLFAAPPVLEHVFPAAVCRASTNVMAVAGKIDPWPPQLWTDGTGVTITALTNKGQLQIAVAADAAVGPHLLRLYNADGASAPRIFVVCESAETIETEPNDLFSAAQSIPSLPATINGHLNKTGDVDSFAVHLQAGQWLDARVEAYTLASKVDALLRLLTPAGEQQAWNHDFATLDPRLSWRAPSNGTYLVQVMGFKYPADAEVRFTGGDGCVYRLHLQALPHAPNYLPPGNFEYEPNDAPVQAPIAALPGVFSGVIDPVGDEDFVGFKLDKDESVELTLETAVLGSRLDGWLRVIDREGKELGRYDDLGRSPTAKLEWKAPTNGVYYAAMANLVHAGGPDHYYRLSMRRPQPDYLATVAAPSITLTAGETNELKLNVTRLHGFAHKLTAAFEKLPCGLAASALEISEKGGEAVLKLTAQTNAPPAQLPVRILITDSQSGERRPVPFSLTSSSVDNGVPGGYSSLLVQSTDQLWLTIKPPPAQSGVK